MGNRNIVRLTDEQIRAAAEAAGIGYAELKAVIEVETGGLGGFLSDGRPRILFEGHVFWTRLSKRGIDPLEYADSFGDVLYRFWDRSKYRGGVSEWTRLEKARTIHADAADESASWGLFQVMGFNWPRCGTEGIMDFVERMHESEQSQLALSLAFIADNPAMYRALQGHDWATFARLYNGTLYAENGYDTRLAKAYSKYSSDEQD